MKFSLRRDGFLEWLRNVNGNVFFKVSEYVPFGIGPDSVEEYCCAFTKPPLYLVFSKEGKLFLATEKTMMDNLLAEMDDPAESPEDYVCNDGLRDMLVNGRFIIDDSKVNCWFDPWQTLSHGTAYLSFSNGELDVVAIDDFGNEGDPRFYPFEDTIISNDLEKILQ